MSGDGTASPVRPAGVREVARLAGVSTQTVSRVINDNPGVRATTRDRVVAAMAELGYRTNNAARALGTSRTRTLGVIASDATLYGPSSGIAGLESAARARGRWIATAYADASDAGSVQEALQHLLAQGVDGVILVAAHTTALAGLAEHAGGVPLIAMHTGTGAVRQAEGAALAVAHLVGLGHRRIARIGGPADWIEEAARAEGFERGVAAAEGATAGPRWSGDWSAAAGAALAAEVADAVRASGGPTAVVVANDQMALGLVAGLVRRGVGVPDEVSVTGFDDNPDANFYSPPLTTVRLDIAGEARRAVAMVLGQDAPDPQAPALVVRSSTAAVR